MVRCSDGTLYTGYTNDYKSRLAKHNSGRGAKYTATRKPVTLVFLQRFDTKEDAMRREYEIKHRLSKKDKEALISSPLNLIDRIAAIRPNEE